MYNVSKQIRKQLFPTCLLFPYVVVNNNESYQRWIDNNQTILEDLINELYGTFEEKYCILVFNDWLKQKKKIFDWTETNVEDIRIC